MRSNILTSSRKVEEWKSNQVDFILDRFIGIDFSVTVKSNTTATIAIQEFKDNIWRTCAIPNFG